MRAFTVTRAQIDACPVRSLLPEHYRDDGTCRCSTCSVCDGSGRLDWPDAEIGDTGHGDPCPACSTIGDDDDAGE